MKKTRAEILGANLKRIRTERGVSRKELAAAIGVTEGHVGLYETAKRQPPLDKIFNAANFLQTPVSNLIGDNEFSDSNAKVFEWRLQRALNVAFAVRAFPTTNDDGTIFMNVPVEIERDDETGKFFVKHLREVTSFSSTVDFVVFMEAVEDTALRDDISVKQALKQMLKR